MRLSLRRGSGLWSAHNGKTHVVPYKADRGDYVVLARTQGPRPKLFKNWIGPRRVSRILSDLIFELEHLLTGTIAVGHVCSIKPYADASFGTKAQMKDVTKFTDRIWYSVDKSEKPLTASKFSSAGKNSLSLLIPGSHSPSISKPFQSLPSEPDFFAVLALPSSSRPTVGDC